MIRLRTIGQLSVHIGDKPVRASNELIIASLLYLAAERGKPISRKMFAEVFFADSEPDAAMHSGRNLIYRLRKDKGVAVDGDPSTITFSESVEWDVEQILARGNPTDAELDALQRGYLQDFAHNYGDAFSRWLDEHRSAVTRKLRDLLITHTQASRAKRNYRGAGKYAAACLGLDPLNEAATLAMAEYLTAIGAKTSALELLDRYIQEVGPRSDLRIAPKLLRERIAEYVAEPDRDQTALVGRAEELETLKGILDEAAAGRPQACLISGQGGIGKTRLVEEACSIATLTGHSVAHVRLAEPDIDRPFAILRDLGPVLLDLPGALGAAPEALAAVRGLCGRGPTQYSRRPTNAYDARAVAMDVQRRVVDLASAVSDEQPLVIRIENADYIDEASLELIETLLASARRLCVFMASRLPLKLSDAVPIDLSVTRIHLNALSVGNSRALLDNLFAQTGQPGSELFVNNAVRISAGVPLFLRLLFKNYLTTQDPNGLPSTLSDLLTARLNHLEEPAKGVMDVVVILGALSTVRRIGDVSALPTYSLAEALRTLEEQGFLRLSEGAILPSHDLLAEATRRRMPLSVSQLLHRATANALERDSTSKIDPLEIAIHWQEAGEEARASQVIVTSARQFMSLGQPRQAISLLQKASEWETCADHRATIDSALLEACQAAGEDRLGFETAERIGAFSRPVSIDVQLAGIEMAVGAGRNLTPYRNNLERIVNNRSLDVASRGRAARLLMMIAHDHNEEALAARTLALTADIASRTETIIPRLIFHAVFGSSDLAVRLANELYESVQGEKGVGVKLQATWTSAFALWRCGDLDRAHELALRGFETAQAHSVWSASIGFASMLGDLAWHYGDPDRAQEWFEHGLDLMKRSGSQDRSYSLYDLGITLALFRGDARGAFELLEKWRGVFPSAHPRFGLGVLAYQLMIGLGLRETISEQAVDELLKGHYERQKLGLHDFIADAAIAGLRHLGRFEEAQSLRDEYRRNRKEKWPISQLFKHLNA